MSVRHVSESALRVLPARLQHQIKQQQEIDLEARVERIFCKHNYCPNKREARALLDQIKTQNFKEAVECLELHKVCGDAYIYNNMLHKLTSWSAIRHFFHLIPSHFRTAITLEYFIHQAGNNQNIEEATKAFNEINNHCFTDNEKVRIYNQYILAAGKCRSLELAKEAFEQAKKTKILTSGICGSLIKAAGENQDLTLAKKTFNEAKSLTSADSVFYNIYIDILVKNKNIKEAIQIFEECRTSKTPLHFTHFVENGSHYYNFHGLSHGAGMIALHFIARDWLAKHPKTDVVPPFFCICGKGGIKKENYLTFRNDLMEFIPFAFPKAKCFVNSDNPGQLKVVNLPCKGLVGYY